MLINAKRFFYGALGVSLIVLMTAVLIHNAGKPAKFISNTIKQVTPNEVTAGDGWQTLDAEKKTVEAINNMADAVQNLQRKKERDEGPSMNEATKTALAGGSGFAADRAAIAGTATDYEFGYGMNSDKANTVAESRLIALNMDPDYFGPGYIEEVKERARIPYENRKEIANIKNQSQLLAGEVAKLIASSHATVKNWVAMRGLPKDVAESVVRDMYAQGDFSDLGVAGETLLKKTNVAVENWVAFRGLPADAARGIITEANLTGDFKGVIVGRNALIAKTDTLAGNWLTLGKQKLSDNDRKALVAGMNVKTDYSSLGEASDNFMKKFNGTTDKANRLNRLSIENCNLRLKVTGHSDFHGSTPRGCNP